MMDLAHIRAEIRRLCTDAGYHCYDHVAESIDPPAVVILDPTTITYTRTMSATTEIMLPVTVVAARGDAEAGTRQLDAAVSTGDDSLYTALQRAQSPAWRGQLTVVEASNWRNVDTGDARLVGVDLTLTVYA